jgi:DNA replication protein DnaC
VTTEPLTRTGACLNGDCKKPIAQTRTDELPIWAPKYCSPGCSATVEQQARERNQFFAAAEESHRRRNAMADANLPDNVADGRLTLDRLPEVYAETRRNGGVSPERYREITTLVKDFVSMPPLIRAQAASILFIQGAEGTGKTWLLEAAVGHAVREMKKSATLISPMTTWADIKASSKDDRDQTEAAQFSFLAGVDLLAIDDIARKPTPTEWEVSIILQIVDERYRLHRPTIVSCNYGVNELHDLWSDANDPRKSKTVKLLCDRLGDSRASISVRMDGRSLRREK